MRGIGIGILLSKSVNFDNCNESIAWAYMHCLGFVGTMTFSTPVTNECQVENMRQAQTGTLRQCTAIGYDRDGCIRHVFPSDYCFSTTTGFAYTIEAGINILL